MKDRVSTLVTLQYGPRRSGNTTRQIDFAVQQLFAGAIIEVRDHWEFGDHKKANENLFDRILKRLAMEHGLLVDREVRINKNKLEIELI